MNRDTYVCLSCHDLAVCTVEKLPQLKEPDECMYSGTDNSKANWQKSGSALEKSTAGKLTPCHVCKKPRDGDYIDPCPHCGNDDPF